MTTCAFLGLGVMGFPMAGHLVAAGYDVRVWNRTYATSKKWAETHKGRAYDTLEAAVNEADIVFMCVGNDADVIEVATPTLNAMRQGGILIDHTTASAECARTCYAMAQKKEIGFIDAPISGGESGAINGQLTVMCGGEPEIFNRALPFMESYSKAVKLMGSSGSGQLTKMVNQICIAGILQGLSEGVNFAKKAGLDMNAVLEAIGKGAAQSWQMDNRALTMAKGEFEFGFAVDWMRKDLDIALRTADKIGADLTLAKQVDAYYEEVQALGGNRWDTSSLITRLR